MRRKCDTNYFSRNGFVSSEQAFQCTALANAMQCIVMKMKTPKKRCCTAAANMVRVVLSSISAIHTCEVIVIDEKPQSYFFAIAFCTKCRGEFFGQPILRQSQRFAITKKNHVFAIRGFLQITFSVSFYVCQRMRCNL